MYKIEADYNQQWFLPPCIEDWIPADHPARFIREVVAGMDLSALGFNKQAPVEGRPPYANELLLRIWLFGYWERIRSSRKLEKACGRDLAFIWLCGNNAPDHNTLWRFFRDNKKALRAVFKQTVRVAMDMDLVGLALQAVDGTKIQAACSGRGGFERDSLEALLAKLDDQVAKLEAAIEKENHRAQTEEPSLPEKLQKSEALRDRVAEALRKINEGETRHCSPVEQDARRMKCDGKNRFGHNAQVVVDESDQVIVASDVVGEATDNDQLVPMVEQAAENTGTKSATTLADGGYSGGEHFQAAENGGHTVLAHLPAGSKNKKQHAYHASNFKYDQRRDVFLCPAGRQIPFQRERFKDGKLIRVYRSAQVCRNCPVRANCTKDRHGRTMELRPGTAALERMRRRLTDPAQHELLKKRGRIVEPIFAQIKQNDSFRRWTVYGLDNVRTQWALLCLTWNLRKIYQAWRSRQRPSPRQRRACALRSLLHHLLNTCSSVAVRPTGRPVPAST